MLKKVGRFLIFLGLLAGFSPVVNAEEALAPSDSNVVIDGLAGINSMLQSMTSDKRLTIRQTSATLQIKKAQELYDAGKYSQAIALLDSLIAQFSNDEELSVSELVVHAYDAKSFYLHKAGQTEEALANALSAIDLYSDDARPQIKFTLGRIYLQSSALYLALNRGVEALPVLSQLIASLDSTTDPALQEILADAYLYKAAIYEKLEQPKSAAGVYSTLIAHLENTDNETLQVRLAKAYIWQAGIYYDLNQKQKAFNNYREVIRLFVHASQPEIREQFAIAVNAQAYEHLLSAKKYWRARPQQAISELQLAQQAFDYIETYAEDSNVKAMIYGNQAYTLWLSGDARQAEDKLRQALDLDGKYVYDVTLDDLKKYPVRQDAGFRALLERLWAVQEAKSF